MLLDPTLKVDFKIMSAIRGPDTKTLSHGEIALKDVTTAVIRGYIGIRREEFVGTVLSPKGAKTFWVEYYNDATRREARELYQQSDNHFVRHVSAAFDALLVKLPDAEKQELREYLDWLREEMGQ